MGETVKPETMNLETVINDRLATVMGGAKKPSLCGQAQGTGEWFPNDAVDPELATFKTKRACEAWARKNPT
jgi:hypothetical protein